MYVCVWRQFCTVCIYMYMYFIFIYMYMTLFIQLRYVKTREEQARILSLCHVHPASGYPANEISYTGALCVAWTDS